MIKICEQCNKEYKTRATKRRYCCYECSRLAKIINIPKLCPQCGTIFKPSSANSVYCSITCRGLACTVIHEVHYCKICNKPLNTGKIYCSVECRNLDKAKIPALCKRCGNKFFYSGFKTQMHCSQKCMGLDKRGEWFTRACPTCGKEFSTNKAKGRRLFCSWYCFKRSNPNRETTLETQLYSYLESRGLNFIKQHSIGRLTPDAYLPEYKTCLFADGEYWHKPDLVKEKDKKAKETLENLGYKVGRFLSVKNKLIESELEAFLNTIE